MNNIAGAQDGAGKIAAPFLIYFGDVSVLAFAKTGLGLIEWRRADCIGQVRLPGCIVDGNIPDMTIDDAVTAGARSLVVGVAPNGGVLPDAWVDDIAHAAASGLNIVSGLHNRLSTFKQIADAANKGGSELIDVRVPPANLPVGSGRNRSGLRLLTVGTDCAVGKKYTALALEREMRARGLNAQFRATGQTGVIIAGGGFPIDSVIADFISGAAEALSPSAADDHWDIVEGQGALSHPSFAGVALGLLHGSQPDAMVLCHDPSRKYSVGTDSDSGFTLPSLTEAMSTALLMARRVNKNTRFVGVSVNTSQVDQGEKEALLKRYEDETGLPAVDALRDGVGRIVDKLVEEFGA